MAKQETPSAQPTQRTVLRGGPGAPGRTRRRRLLVSLAVFGLILALIVQATAREMSGPRLPLRTIVDIPLAGGSSRFDYESLDQRTRLLFIAHLGAGMVSVLDTRSNRIVATIPRVAGVHGVLAVPRWGGSTPPPRTTTRSR